MNCLRFSNGYLPCRQIQGKGGYFSILVSVRISCKPFNDGFVDKKECNESKHVFEIRVFTHFSNHTRVGIVIDNKYTYVFLVFEFSVCKGVDGAMFIRIR